MPRFISIQQAKVDALESEKLMWWDAYMTATESANRRKAGRKYEQAAEVYESERDYLDRLIGAAQLSYAF